MNKKHKILLLILCFVCGTFLFRKYYKTVFTLDRVEYEVYIDGVSSTTFPSKGNYSVSVACTNSSASWDYVNWKMKIADATSNTDSCYVSFYSIKEKNYLNEYLISLAGTTQGASSVEGKLVLENGYRYQGYNPYNYVYFNDELWRIIGVFDSETHGIANTNLVKIIKDTSIGGYAYSASSSKYNTWNMSSLNKLLNTYYYNATDGTADESCRLYSTTIKRNCNYTKSGIQSNYRNMIKNANWYYGGIDLTYTAKSSYIAERDTNKKITSNIGLMYASDYAYTAPLSSCARSTTLGNYNNEGCTGSSWIINSAYEWTITPNKAHSQQLFIINPDTLLTAATAHTGHGVRPVIYLNENTYVLGGNGSKNNPYILGI